MKKESMPVSGFEPRIPLPFVSSRTEHEHYAVELHYTVTGCKWGKIKVIINISIQGNAGVGKRQIYEMANGTEIVVHRNRGSRGEAEPSTRKTLETKVVILFRFKHSFVLWTEA
jgi:hypothetical protein